MLTQLRIRCPDKPHRTSQDSLVEFDQEDCYIATVKYDGWRCIIDWDGENVGFFSRRDIDSGGPTRHKVCDELVGAVKAFLLENEVPADTRLDSEWLARRTTGPEQIFIFGVQYWGGQWLGRELETVRWELIAGLKYNQQHVNLAENTRHNYSEFFQRVMEEDTQHSEKNWKVEGIVLKHVNSKLLGNLKTSKKNSRWYKVKWRDGASGKAPTF
ncbi:MAG: ATP-dependent DNA ligase [Candidatus Thorarchaeota archaeon]|jgi:ATP-dependent DNA ligase